MAGSRLWTGEDKARILSCAARERRGRAARRIADGPNALKVQVWRRLRPPAEHSGSGEASSAELAPKANLVVAKAHEDAEVARINREARLPLSAPSLEPQAQQIG